MGDRKKVFTIFVISVILLSTGLAGLYEDVYAEEKGRTTSLEALGILQVAAHDLYHFDRCGEDPNCAVENEDGKLNLSTLFEIKTFDCTAFEGECDTFDDDEIRNGDRKSVV